MQLLVAAVADAQSVLHDLQESLSAQSQEVAVLAQQQREVRTAHYSVTRCVSVRWKYECNFIAPLYVYVSEISLSQAAQRSLEAARDITQSVMASLSTMETDANNFREHVNSSSVNHDQELLDLAVVYEV